MPLDVEFPEDFTAKPLQVEFTLPKAGWINCRVRPLHEKFAISCTYIWDPFPRFIAWLEAIAAGSDSATWLVDQEGSCSRVQFYGEASSIDDKSHYILHLRFYESLERIRGAKVERRQVVESSIRPSGPWPKALTMHQGNGRPIPTTIGWTIWRTRNKRLPPRHSHTGAITCARCVQT